MGTMKSFRLILKLCVLCVSAVIILSGCALRTGENRKVTAWGVWCTAAACGVGYWHSERGPDVESEKSAEPSIPLISGGLK